MGFAMKLVSKDEGLRVWAKHSRPIRRFTLICLDLQRGQRGDRSVHRHLPQDS